ncbi:MAG: SRPBCC family protein [Spirochaetota bacterium]
MKKTIQFLSMLAIISLSFACSASFPVKEEGSQKIYTSQFDNKKGMIHGVNLAKMAKGAPLRIVAMVHTSKSPEDAWKASLFEIAKWSGGQITEVKFRKQAVDGGDQEWSSVAKGDYRNCNNPKEGQFLVEEIRHIDHGKKFYVYSVDFENTKGVPFPMKNHTGAVTVEADGAGGSLLTFRAYFDRNLNPMSLVFPTMFRNAFNQYMNNFAQTYGGVVVNSKFNK